MYDPAVARWFVMDPLADKYNSFSAYSWVANNPLILIDPTGEDIIIWYEENGKRNSFVFTGSTDGAPNNKYVAQVIEAWSYNVGNRGGDPSFEAATNSDIKVNVYETDGETIHDPSVNAVYWNPNLGNKTDEGNVSSPATVLDHEFDHAVQAQKKPKEFINDRSTKRTDGYDNNEEYRVITGSEQKQMVK